jgi:hypothetical protein
MIKQLRWLFPGGCFSLGLYLLRYSYHAYSDWQVYLELGDYSGAELPEIEFKWSATIALALILLSGFVAGRWSVRRRKN